MLLSDGGVNYWHSVIASELDRVEEGTRVEIFPIFLLMDSDSRFLLS